MLGIDVNKVLSNNVTLVVSQTKGRTCVNGLESRLTEDLYCDGASVRYQSDAVIAVGRLPCDRQEGGWPESYNRRRRR